MARNHNILRLMCLVRYFKFSITNNFGEEELRAVMKRTILRLFLWSLIVGACIVYLSGCASTKPNTPYPGLYPSRFNELSINNPLLAQELSKIPEIQDGISDEDTMALEQICMFYKKNQRAFNSAFEQMYEVGNPVIRKFCTPLQALYWLALDDRSRMGIGLSFQRPPVVRGVKTRDMVSVSLGDKEDKVIIDRLAERTNLTGFLDFLDFWAENL